MGKFFDAETCYLFSEALFEMHLGCFHDRTSNVKRNLMKLKKDSKLGKKWYIDINFVSIDFS